MRRRLHTQSAPPTVSGPTPSPAAGTSAAAPASGHSFGSTPVLQRQPAPEDPELRRRRLQAAAAARVAIDRLTGSLDRGYLLEGEVLTADGRIDAIYEARVETREVRAARLRTLIRDLRALVTVLDAGPVDPSWFEPHLDEPKAKTSYTVGGREAWQDTAALYLHRQQARGESVGAAVENVFSIQTKPIPTPAIARTPIRTGIGTGIYLIVPDPVGAPLVYRRLTQYEGWQERGVIVEVWSDDFGYFYWSSGSKVYLPGRP
jgi:hypothetical protein